MTKLIVDNRERGALLPLFRELSDGFGVEALPVGDVLVAYPAGHGFLVERKTAADLAASICDGRRPLSIGVAADKHNQTKSVSKRWAEQMNRLLSSGRRAFVIIEGDLRRCDLYESSLSAWLNLSLRGDISVLRTTTVRETFEVIVALVSKLEAPPRTWTPSSDGGVRPPKLVGKRQKDAACVDVRQLMCVPSISFKIAKKLLDHFGSLRELRTALGSESFPAVRLDERHCLGKARLKHLRRHMIGEDGAGRAAKQKHTKTTNRAFQ